MEVVSVENYISTSEAAERLGVTQRTIARWVSKGCFPGAIKVNPQFKHSPYLIPVSAIEEFEASREIGTEGETPGESEG